MFLYCEKNSTEVQENLELVDLIMNENSAQHIRACEEGLIWYCSSQHSPKQNACEIAITFPITSILSS